MSNFPNRLGPQAHQLNQRTTVLDLYSSLVQNPTYQIPAELDYLLYDIANCKTSTPPEKILSYLAYYYPKLKAKQNVELLTTHFFKCPIFFGSFGLSSLENNAKIIECFQYLITEKFKISHPTIPFHEFYISVYNALREVSQTDPSFYWKSIPVLAGCIGAISPMKQYNEFPAYSNVISNLNGLFIKMYTDSFLQLMEANLPSGEFKNTFLISLPYVQEHLLDSFYTQLSISNPAILSELMSLLFSSKAGLDKGSILFSDVSYSFLMKSKPVLRQLNKWVFVYGRTIIALPSTENSITRISASLDHIVSFCTNISNESLEKKHFQSDMWDFVKYVFFTIIMLFEHQTNAIISGRLGLSDVSFMISNQVLRSLFYLSYILDEIGTGGFDAYNFVFSSMTNLLLERKLEMTEILEYSLLNEIPTFRVELTRIEESKMNFFLRLTEVLIPALKETFKQATLFPLLTEIFANPNSSQNSVEFAHSIMIRHLNLIANDIIKIQDRQEYIRYLEDTVFSYFDKVISQFPKRLSLAQTSLITQTCGKVVSKIKKPQNESVTTLFDLIKFQTSISAFTPLPPIVSHVNGQEVIVSERLNTRHAGLVSLLIDLVQFFTIDSLVPYLETIKKEIDKLIGDHDIYTLYDILWDKLLVINKFDSQKGQLGINWWYDSVNNGLVPKL
jgi:hypothetical protein